MEHTQYSKEYLEERDTCKLGLLYIERFIASQDSPAQSSQLELILEVLLQRPAEELRSVHREIQEQLIAAAERKDHLMVYLLQEVRIHFEKHVS